MPETSIIIRTLNEEKHLGNLLRALQNQDYKKYEIIIVDSGSNDATLDIARQFPTTVLSIESRDFTFGYSLNIGCRAAKGKYLVFASAHTLPVNNRWLGNLVAPFTEKEVAMVYGRQMGDPGAKFSERRDLYRLFGESAFNSHAVLDYANNANAAVRRALWEEHHFDEYLFGLEDIEWVRWATGRGHIVHYAPEAGVYHIHREAWHQVFNRYRREAIAAARIGLPHPPQARIEVAHLFFNLLMDVIDSFPNWSPARLNEILWFRYYQWRGSRQGWLYDKHLDFDREKFSLFFPEGNRALVIHGKGKASIEQVPLPDMKPGDILVQVSHVGICRTDLEVHEGTLGYYRDGVANYPIIPGHEFSGVIVQIGANNKFRERFKVGDRVVGECILSRGEHGPRQEIGVINRNGACGEFVAVPGDQIHKVPDTLDLKTAALAEPLAVVLRALRRLQGRLVPASTVAVVGAGPIGNFCAQILAGQGHTVTVFDPHMGRLALLKRLVEAVKPTLAGLEHFDVLIEATGSKEALERVLKDSRVDSTILLLGFPYGDIGYNFEDIVGREKVIVGSVGADWDDFAEALRLLPTLDTAPFIETILPLERFEEAWNLHRSGKHLKIMLKP